MCAPILHSSWSLTHKQSAEIKFSTWRKKKTLNTGMLVSICWCVCVTHADYCYSRLLPICHNSWKLQTLLFVQVPQRTSSIQYIINTMHDAIIAISFSIPVFYSFARKTTMFFYLAATEFFSILKCSKCTPIRAICQLDCFLSNNEFHQTNRGKMTVRHSIRIKWYFSYLLAVFWYECD